MLDIKRIREQPDEVKVGLEKKGEDPANIDEILLVDEKRRVLQTKADSLRAKRNQLGPDDRQQAKSLKEELELLEQDLAVATGEYQALMLKLPNLPLPDVPTGRGEEENVVVRKEGELPAFDFSPKDHLELGRTLDLIDSERAAKVSGTRFVYLKNQLALLEFALLRFGLDLLTGEGFTPMIPPVLVSHDTMVGAGFFPQGEEDVFKTQDELYLAGTSEGSVVAYYKDEILDRLPQRFVAFSSCFRREAGSYGKDVRGMIRVHQFDKLEMVSFTKPEDSETEFNFLLSLQERIMKDLKLPYQVVAMCTGDLGLKDAKRYDLETWLPGQERYRETHSVSNVTDFQARRLNIRYRSPEGPRLVHTLNGTAIAMPRTLAAILENGQQADGSVRIPDALLSYTGFTEIKI